MTPIIMTVASRCPQKGATVTFIKALLSLKRPT